MSCFKSDCILHQVIYNWYCRICVPKLYRHAIDGKWERIPRRCQVRPREARFVYSYAPNDTALHRIVRPPDETGMEYITSLRFAPDDIKEITRIRLQAIEAIVAAYPGVTTKTDCFGRAPLHLACMDIGYSFGAAEFLVDACPTTASLQDKSGRTPLHYLVANNIHIPPSVLEKIVTAFPEAITMQDKSGQCPITIASDEHKEMMALVLKTLQVVPTCNTQSSTSSASTLLSDSLA